MNGLRPHFFAGGVPLSRADFPGDTLRDWIAYTLAFSANVHFGDKDAALELFYSEADSIYERCEQEILSRLAKSPCAWNYLLASVPLGFVEHEVAASAVAVALIECFQEVEDSVEPVDAAQRIQDHARKIVELLTPKEEPQTVKQSEA